MILFSHSVESSIEVLLSPCAHYCLILTKFEILRPIIFVKVHSVKFDENPFGRTLEDGTERLSWNVGKELPPYAV